MTLEEMIARQQILVSAARAAGHDLTAEEQREFDQLQGQIDLIRSAASTAGSGSVGITKHAASDGGAPETADGVRGGGGDAQRAVAEERQRLSDIVALCRQTGMEPDTHIRNGDSIDSVRTAAVAYMIQHGTPVETRMSDNQSDDFRHAAIDAMLMRAGIRVEQPTEGAEQLQGLSMRDLAIECMSRDGEGSQAWDIWLDWGITAVDFRGIARNNGVAISKM